MTVFSAQGKGGGSGIDSGRPFKMAQRGGGKKKKLNPKNKKSSKTEPYCSSKAFDAESVDGFLGNRLSVKSFTLRSEEYESWKFWGDMIVRRLDAMISYQNQNQNQNQNQPALSFTTPQILWNKINKNKTGFRYQAIKG
ncbi:hypothetical protein REPUB_Repub17cG0164600 [Reevesia pubescens]